ncbi:hypothetical protein F7018_08995 [Tenacibaculum aiptasiae]|uniref:Uncharacterized protein n=1 Tax=Tenacibaculum aiptasiae TaxID=426481 RepID=A0A7J5AL29_9FLAO|nr:hypothetical protein [Tenacibaculum aiptasiae]KAB1158312.1 hypothetical protein F7018_08995 [Tenacibaculum aiptasiae]
MNEINIFINAFGLIGDNYEEKEVLHEKILTKDLSDNHLNETDLKQILETIITSIKEIKLLYPDEQTNITPHNCNRLDSIKFEIKFIDNTNTSITLEEPSFFELAAKHESLTSLIIEYCKTTDNGEDGNRLIIRNEYDQGPPAGTHAILSLVHQNKKWIPYYIQFLRTNDLEHEIEQIWDIEAILKKYGWCVETHKLAIARNISCCGQAGKEQFDRFIENGLEKSLNNKRSRDIFLESILNEFQEWKSFHFRLKDGSFEYYKKYIISYVQHFEKLLTKSEITSIESFLLQKWDDYNKTIII